MGFLITAITKQMFDEMNATEEQLNNIIKNTSNETSVVAHLAVAYTIVKYEIAFNPNIVTKLRMIILINQF